MIEFVDTHIITKSLIFSKTDVALLKDIVKGVRGECVEIIGDHIYNRNGDLIYDKPIDLKDFGIVELQLFSVYENHECTDICTGNDYTEHTFWVYHKSEGFGVYKVVIKKDFILDKYIAYVLPLRNQIREFKIYKHYRDPMILDTVDECFDYVKTEFGLTR